MFTSRGLRSNWTSNAKNGASVSVHISFFSTGYDGKKLQNKNSIGQQSSPTATRQYKSTCHSFHHSEAEQQTGLVLEKNENVRMGDVYLSLAIPINLNNGVYLITLESP